MKKAVLPRDLDAVNSLVVSAQSTGVTGRFDEKGIASVKPIHGLLSYKQSVQKILGSAVIGLIISPIFAFDADTLGFYTFNDGDAGTSAIGAMPTNSIAGSTISAAKVAHASSSSQLRSATFLSARPGKYIYASSRDGAELIAVEPQSVHLESSTKKSEGGEGESMGTTLSFSDAGRELSKHHDTGFTVEFFMLMNPGEYWYVNSHQMFLMCGYKDKAKNTYNHMAFLMPHRTDVKYSVGFASAAEPRYNSGSTADISTTGSFRNGQWHHIAFVERTIDGAIHFQTYVDGNLLTDYALETDNIDVTSMSDTATNGYFQFGRGSLTAAISCVRFTKRSLDPDEFLYAADAEPHPAGQGAFAFYPFTGVTPGESAVGATAINQVKPGKFSGTVSTNSAVNAFALFDADAPGKFVYDGRAGSVVCTNPCSLHVGSDDTSGKGGSLSIANIGTELSHHHENGHTIEYFYKVDGTRCSNYTLHMAVNGGYLKPEANTADELRLYAPESTSNMKHGWCSLNYYDDTNPCRFDFTMPTAPNNGDWHHVAIVETVEANIELYVDYTYCGKFALGGRTAITDSAAFRFFANAIQGKVSCIRFTDHQLDVKGFLRAMNRPLDPVNQPDVVAFYSFKDGDVASSVQGVTLYNDVASEIAPGTVSLGASATGLFDDDAPGAEIYGGEERPTEPFALNPRSIVLDAENAGSSGSIKFPELSKVFYAAHGTGFTFEYFFKFLDDEITPDDPSFQVNAGYKNAESTLKSFNLTIPVKKTGLFYYYGFGYDTTEGNQKRADIPSVLWDGAWHHFAYVETPVVDTSVTPAVTNWSVMTYLDHKPCSGGAYTIPEVVASTAGLGSGNGLELCRNKHHCKYSCLKVTARPLGVREFMRTKPAQGLVLIVR